ncbi:MAG TPA: molybdopterin-binding protein, partial [Roseiarcus sp.]|nr:molybdopterin-binding protein [Roseiarcus sp.]
MKFGPVPVAEAVGAIVAHTIRSSALILRKGQVVTREHQAALTSAGFEAIIAARLEADDVGEDEAARRLAGALAGPHIRLERAFTGRVNLFAEVAGLAVIEATAIDRLNEADEAITAATLAPYHLVAPGDMVATVKIIPFAVSGAALRLAISKVGVGAVCVAPFRPLRIGVVSTIAAGLKPSVVAKTLRILEDRLAPAGARIARETRVPHEAGALAEALAPLVREADVVVIFGASAITDRRDVIPAAITESGGRIDHFGMPVDPGNLLLLGELAGKPVI